MVEELRAGWLPCVSVALTVIAVTAICNLGAPGFYLGAFIGVPIAGLWAERRSQHR